MSRSNDRRLLNQSEAALHRVSDWLRELEHVAVPGTNLDALGEIIFGVEEARAELDEPDP
jgi:hypothetical protein